jgi:hypothetical protein
MTAADALHIVSALTERTRNGVHYHSASFLRYLFPPNIIYQHALNKFLVTLVVHPPLDTKLQSLPGATLMRRCCHAVHAILVFQA